MSSPVLLVLTNVPDRDVAQAIARGLVESRLAACVNILPPVQSVYQWQGRVEEATELTLLVKTTATRYDEVEQMIVSIHPYDVPEVVAVPLSAGLPAYLGWVEREVRKELDV